MDTLSPTYRIKKFNLQDWLPGNCVRGACHGVAIVHAGHVGEKHDTSREQKIETPSVHLDFLQRCIEKAAGFEFEVRCRQPHQFCHLQTRTQSRLLTARRHSRKEFRESLYRVRP